MRCSRIAGTLLGLAFAAGCDGGGAPAGPPPPEVIVATAWAPDPHLVRDVAICSTTEL